VNLAGYDNHDSKKRTTEAESRQVNDESLDEDFCFRRPVTLLDFWAERKNLSSPLCPDRKKYMEEAIKVLDSALSHIKWRLKFPAKNRLQIGRSHRFMIYRFLGFLQNLDLISFLWFFFAGYLWQIL
jgi:hypothetical protein